MAEVSSILNRLNQNKGVTIKFRYALLCINNYMKIDSSELTKVMLTLGYSYGDINDVLSDAKKKTKLSEVFGKIVNIIANDTSTFNKFSTKAKSLKEDVLPKEHEKKEKLYKWPKRPTTSQKTSTQHADNYVAQVMLDPYGSVDTTYSELYQLLDTAGYTKRVIDDLLKGMDLHP